MGIIIDLSQFYMLAGKLTTISFTQFVEHHQHQLDTEQNKILFENCDQLIFSLLLNWLLLLPVTNKLNYQCVAK